MKNITAIINALKKEHPSTFFDRNTTDPFYVLIATLLSQRTRDEITYEVAPELFKKLRNPKEFSRASEAEIIRLIKRVGFYRRKADRIKKIAGILLEKHNGKVPGKFDELTALPGVGRKTANCVLVYAFKKPSIPVDTHVHRVSNRIGLVRTKTPEETEMKLMKTIPKKHWMSINELLVKHGQTICRPVNPKCEKCPITRHCDYYRNVLSKYSRQHEKSKIKYKKSK